MCLIDHAILYLNLTKESNDVMWWGQLEILSKHCFSKEEVECNFAELVDLLNSDRICSLEVAWILEDITLIRDIFYFTIIIIIASILLRCNSDALTLTSAAKEKENVIAWLEEYLSFLFPILLQDSILMKSRIDSAQKKKKYIYYFCVSSLVRKMIWRLGPGPWVFESTKEEVYPCTFFRLHFVKYGEKWNKYVKRKISWQLCFLHNFNYDR